jgi:hypothetical protein
MLIKPSQSVARMSGAICGTDLPAERPGFRLAPSGLRLLMNLVRRSNKFVCSDFLHHRFDEPIDGLSL